MKNNKTLLSLLIAGFFLVSVNAFAQEAPPVPRTKSKSQKKQSDDKQSDDKKDDEKSEDNKSEDNKSDSKKKADNKKSDDKKADDKKADDKKKPKADDDEKDDEPKTEAISPRRLGGIWSRSSKNTKRSEDFVSAFESVVASANESTLSIMAGKRQIALGTVVDSNGLILTKASELRGTLGCKMQDGKILAAKVIGVDPKTDLALLKVDVENLNVIQWADDLTPPTMGRWVATPKAERKGQPTIGVVGVNARAIPASSPFIGVMMADIEDEDGVRIESTIVKSPARAAGLLPGDVVFKVNGIADDAKDRASLSKAIKSHKVNDRITLTIRRKKKEMDIKVTLGERDKISPDSSRSNTQNSMGSVLSKRRKNFPESFQHDSMLGSSTCGGPIVDLSGKAVGINIARAGRVASLALTAEVVLPILEKLKSGNYAPVVVNRAAIEILSFDLAELNDEIGDLPAKKQRLELGYHKERAKKSEIENMIRELEDRKKEIEKRESESKKKLDTAKKELEPMLKSKFRLETDLLKLRTGSR